jgi:type I restriction enzyme, S subunit
MKLRAGYKQTEVGVIPEDWQIHSLAELADLTSSKRIFGDDYVSSGIPFYRGKEISQLVSGDALEDVCYITEKRFADIKSRFGAPVRGDILITSVGTLGNIYRVDHDSPFYFKDGNLIWLRSVRRIDSQFLCVQLRHAKDEILEGAIGSSQKALTIVVLKKLLLAVPPQNEQRGIAIALSDVDVLLTKIDQLIAKKRDLKQAAMQQLLTGQTRLPGFSGKWVVKRLGDVVEIRKGQLITEKTVVFGEIPVIAGGKKPAYFHNEPNRTGKTITVSASGASAGYVALFDRPIFASDCSTISEGRHYSIEFIFFQMQLRQDAIYRAQTGGAQPHIHAVDLAPIEIGCPEPEEQTAIATVLSDMDAELAALEVRRDKTRVLKQGMMRALLTGRIRLVGGLQLRVLADFSIVLK